MRSLGGDPAHRRRRTAPPPEASGKAVTNAAQLADLLSREMCRWCLRRL